MIQKLTIIGVVFVAILSLGVGLNLRQNALHDNRSTEVLTLRQQDQNADEQVSKWVRDLGSNNSNERSAAKEALLNLSTRSAATRDVVIKQLLKIIKLPDKGAEFVKSPARYSEWREAVDVLGLMRATEAIDDLVDCLDCNNGVAGLAVDRFPATVSIIKIGGAAIPKLSEAIQDRRPFTRHLAAMALSQIGGDKAKSELEKASAKEKDRDVSFTMRNLLKNWGKD
jgi:HEAT repeat protein